MIFIITILRNNEGYFFGAAIYMRVRIYNIRVKKNPLEKTENTFENGAVRKRPTCGIVVAMVVCACTCVYVYNMCVGVCSGGRERV